MNQPRIMNEQELVLDKALDISTYCLKELYIWVAENFPVQRQDSFNKSEEVTKQRFIYEAKKLLEIK